MIDVIFALNYQQQLRQTQPRFFSLFEDAIISLMESFGGDIRKEHKYLCASFDEQSLAFWLDMLIFIEKLDEILKESASELYGHVCLVCSSKIDPQEYAGMLRELSVQGNCTGIWLAADISEHLRPYIEFDDASELSFITKKMFHVLQVKELKKNYSAAEKTGGVHPLRKAITDALGNVPPLVFCFGTGGRGLSCVSDAFMPEIKQFLEADASSLAAISQLENLKELIGRERLRSEYPPFVIEKSGEFLFLLVESYVKAAKTRNIDPVIILENVDEMNDAAHTFMIQKVKALRLLGGISIYYTANTEKNLSAWKSLNVKMISSSAPGGKPLKTSSGQNLPPDMKELWEILYMCHLLRSYFPEHEFVSIFSEERKNPLAIIRAFKILYALGIISSLRDTKPVMPDFPKTAEKVLGKERIRVIKGMVRNRLLAWVDQEKLLPCFNLLTALVSLGGDCGGDLILDAMYRDVIDGVYGGLKHCIYSGAFLTIAGNERLPSLEYIFHTLIALMHGDEEAIQKAFLSAPPDEIPSLRYESYIESNLASYQISIRNMEEAVKSVKKSMLAAQKITKQRGEARAFRLYALANFIKGNVVDAVEYLQFAGDHAERSKDWEESVIINYDASLVQFLFGNISASERFAGRAESLSLRCGLVSWGAKARFLRGRILFEQGRYNDAYDMFQSIAPTEENQDVLDAWKFRAKAYLGDFLPEDIKNNGDGAVFMIEAAYINEEYEKTIKMADQLLLDLPDHQCIFLEQPDWQSGFSQAELMMFPQKDFLHRFVSTYRALALSRQSPFEAAAAVTIMRQITRDEKFFDTDANDEFYFFAQYQALQNADALEIDQNTAISMAFKRLQRHASRIDDIKTKRDFLTLNRWNKALGEAAKTHRLI